MIEPHKTRVMAVTDHYNDKDIEELIMRSEKEQRMIEKPQNKVASKALRRIVHGVIAARLVSARNRSGLNNDKINRLMLEGYLDRRREGKAWSFTNALSPKTNTLLDSEEVEMLSRILNVEEAVIGMHLSVLPWAIQEQREERAEQRKKAPRANRKAKPARVQNNKAANQSRTSPETTDRVDQAVNTQALNSPAIPQHAGDLKITHSGSSLHVHGKVWCDRSTAQKLRMIIPLKLINQARADDPWCYEMNGPVHSYQLYNLMHVLYATPRVLEVELE